jgi:hypothetical protein
MNNTDTAPPQGGAAHSATHAEEIRSAMSDTSDAAKSAMSDAKAKLGAQGGEKVDAATTSAGESLRAVAEQLRQAGDNLGEDQGWARQAFSQGAQGIERVSAYLRDGRMDTFAGDLQSFARQNPAAFLAGGVALGFLAARVAKTAAEHAAQPAASSPPEPQPVAADPFGEPRSFAPLDDGASGYAGGDL